MPAPSAPPRLTPLIRDAYRALIKDDLKPNYSITLVFNRGAISEAEARDRLGKFLGSVDTLRLGQNYWRIRPEDRVRGIFFAENTGSNYHYHGSLFLQATERMPDLNVLVNKLDGIWRAIVPSGNVDCKAHDDAVPHLSVTGWSRYSTKQLCSTPHAPVFAGEFHSYRLGGGLSTRASSRMIH
jgi:hypothetical protein